MYRFFLLFLFIGPISFGQTSLNDYVKTMERSSSFEEKYKAFKKIDDLTYEKDNEAFVKYANQFIDIAIKSKEFDVAANLAVDLCGVYSRFMAQPDKALDVIRKILPYEKDIKNSKNRGNIYLKRAAYYYHGNDFEKAIEDYTSAINTFTSKDSIYIADAIYFRGQARSYQGNLLDAIKDYETAIIYYQNLKDYSYVVNTNASLALLYSDNGFYEEANKIRDEYVTSAIEKGDYRLAATTYLNKAIEAGKLNDLKKKEAYLMQAETFFKKLKGEGIRGLTLVYCKMTELYAEKSDLKKAHHYLSKVANEHDILKNNNLILVNYYIAKSLLEKARKNYAVSLQLLKKSEQLSKNWKNVKKEIWNEKLFYEIYREMGNTKEALSHYEKYSSLKDSVFSVQKTNALLYYQNLYELERKDKSLKEKEANIQLLEKTNTIRTNWMIFGGFGLCCLFGFFFILRSKAESDKKKQLQEVYSQNLILAQENERKRIASELHDGLGQNLLLIKNHLVSNDSDDLKNLTNNTINEMRSIAMNLHPYQLQEFGLTKAILMNLKKFEQSTSDVFVSYEVDNLDNLFNEVAQINIYRIIQECITNIVKHAKATAARFVLEKKGSSIRIVINDNGSGYNFQKSILSQSSLGLKTLQERVNLLKGIMTVISEKGKGSKIEFEIPVL